MGVDNMDEGKVIDGGRIAWAMLTSGVFAWLLAQIVEGVWRGTPPGVPWFVTFLGGMIFLPSRWVAAPQRPNLRWLVILGALTLFLSLIMGSLCRYWIHVRPLWSTLLGAWLIAVIAVVTLFHYVRPKAVGQRKTWTTLCSWPVVAGSGCTLLAAMISLCVFAYDTDWACTITYLLAVLCIGSLTFSRQYLNPRKDGISPAMNAHSPYSGHQRRV